MCVGGFNGQRSFFALGEYFGSLLAQHNNEQRTTKLKSIINRLVSSVMCQAIK